MELWRRRGAEGAAAFAFADLGVDPIVGKKFSGEVAKVGVEGFEGVEYRFLRFCVRERPDFLADRRVLVVERELRQFEQLRFQAKVVMGQEDNSFPLTSIIVFTAAPSISLDKWRCAMGCG